MTIKDQAARRDSSSSGILRRVGLIAALAGASGSLILMLHAGHNNSRILFLIVLFAIWDVSPFIGLVAAGLAAKGWAAPIQTALYSLMLVLTPGTLAIYGYVSFGPPMAKVAAPFLMVPLASWLIIGVVLSLTAFVSGSRQRRAASPE